MCGVLGHFVARDANIDLEGRFQTALRALSNRGPDGRERKTYEDGRLLLGHSLLSITGVDRGYEKQPIEVGSLVIVFNGEIYNYRSLAYRLVAAGRPIKGNTDTAILAAGLSLFGFEFLEQVIGCWAIIVFDREKRRLYFCRDHYGEKHLVYRFVSQQEISVGSEVKALAELSLHSFEVSVERLRSDLIFDFFASRKSTYYAEIENAVPGTLYCVDLGTCELSTRQLVNPVTLARVDGSLRDSLKTATRDMIPDYRPYGIVLSGGLDSSILAGILSQTLSQPVTALTIRYNGANNVDADAASALCAQLGNIDHHLLSLDSSEFSRYFPTVQRVLEEPLYDHVYTSQYLIYRWFQGVGLDVAFNGQASDEFWRGYQYHYALSELDALKSKTNVSDYYLNKARQRGLDRLFSEAELVATIEQELAEFPEHTQAAQIADGLCIGRHLQAMLAHEDRLSMASGVEVRLPFLHRDVIAHALAVSSAEKVVNGLEKAPLREAVYGLIPDFVRLRQKQAFPDAPKEYYLASNAFILEYGRDFLFPSDLIETLPIEVQWKLHAQNAFAAESKNMRLAV